MGRRIGNGVGHGAAGGAAPAPVASPAGRPLCDPADRTSLLWAAILASSLGFIDSSVTAIAIPAIRSALDAGLTGAQWISNAYLVALSALVLAGGAMGDRFGVARIFRLGIVVFAAGSLACTLAQDTGSMIAARAFKGIGAALMVPGSMALIGRLYPREERGRALGLWAAASTATTALGPVLGGMILTWGGPEAWRIVFAVNLPLGAGAWWILRTRVRHDPGRPGTPVDWGGAALATLGLGLGAAALTGAGALAWPLGGAALAVLAGFVAWEARSPHPMMRLGLFADPGFAAANLATLFLYFGLAAVMFYLPMVAIAAWRVTPLEVTAAFVPLSVMIGLLSAPAGRWADRVGAAPLIAGGSALVALAYAALAMTAGQADFWGRAVPAMVVSGLGMALVVAPLTAAVMAAAGDAEQGAASGINNAVSRVAGTMAVAAMGTLAGSVYGTAGPGFGLPGVAPEHVAATGRAFAAVAWTAAAAAAAAAAISLGRARRRG